MIYLLTSSKDTTSYNLKPNTNTGLDQILAISKAITRNEENDIARSFLHFNISNLPSYVTASSTELSLQITEVEQIPLSYTIYANPISESWDMGVGQWEDELPYTGSLTWNYQPKIITTISSSQYFDFEDSDIKMDIKSIYNYWTGSNNFGLRLSHADSVESSSLNYGYLKFYSKETNTFRQPLLKIGFNDQEYNTGSLTPVTSGKEIVVQSKQLKTYYPSGKLTKFKFTTRDRYPLKTFSYVFPYEITQYLPQDSYYSIKDVITGLKIIDFGEYTKISCDSNGSYIKLDTTNFPKNRPLKFEFLINRDGFFEKYEDNLTFEVK